VPFSTSNLLDYYIEAARPWDLNVSGSLAILRDKFSLRINSKLTIAIFTPYKDFCIFEKGFNMIKLLRQK